MPNSTDLILEFLTENHSKNNNSCGVNIPRLLYELDLVYEETKPILKDLLKSKKIFTRKGINGVLVFLNPKILPKAKPAKTKKSPS